MNQELSQTYIDIVGVMLIAINAQEEVTLVNKKSCEVLGYAKEEIIGKNWFDNFLPEKSKKATKAIFQQAMQGNTQLTEYFKNPILTKNQQERLIAWHNTVLYDDNGNIISTLSSGEDITDHYETEKLLKDSEAKYRELSASISDIFFAVDKNFKCIYWNKASEKLTEILEEDAIGKSLYEIFPLTTSNLAEKLYLGTQDKRHNFVTEYKLKNKKLFFEVSVYPSKYGISIFIKNITEKKQLQEALQDSEELYRLTLTNISDAVIMTDDLGNFTFVCPNINVIFGYSVQEIQRFRNIKYLLGEDVFDRKKLEQAQEIKNIEMTIRDKIGNEHTLLVSVKQVFIDDSTTLYSCHDITGHRKTEKILTLHKYIVSASYDHMSFLNKNYIYQVVNDSYLKAHQKKYEEIIGHSVADLLGKEVFEKVAKHNLERCLSGYIVNYQSWFDFPILKHRYMDVFYYPFWEDDKSVSGIVVISRDVTEQKQLKDKLIKLATTDTLTQAYNRIKFEEIIDYEVKMVTRYDSPLSVLLFDIDFFKQINDSYGHGVGDYALKTIVQIVQKNLRQTDYLVRWGGEEFLIILPRTTLKQAKILAERIRKIIEIHRFDKITKTITISLGVTSFIKKDTKDSFIKRADDALYKAKRTGRNKVESINLS